ncbi:MAG: DUF4190 domain-containing protein [Tuberibacillus sp.]
MADKDHPDWNDRTINEEINDHAFEDNLGIAETHEDRSLRSGDDHERYNEEYAAEAALDRPISGDVRDDEDVAGGTGIGCLALVLSVIGLFFLPVIMGAAGIIVGIIARRQGARALGGWAIGIGIAAILIRLFTAPFF